MADILIRGMEKPHNCFRCDLSYLSGERLFCHVTKDEVLRSKIASDCPIQELPEHGDLIDRSKIKFTCAGTTPEDLDYARRYVIDRMPAIVPSNKEETK